MEWLNLKKKKTNVVIGIQWLDSNKWKPLQDIGASHCLPNCLTVQILTATLSEALQKKKKENPPIYQRLF